MEVKNFIILPETNLDDSIDAAEKARLAIEDNIINLTMLSPPLDVTVTTSFGVASINLDTENPDQLIQNADKTLYQAKNDGRNCVRPLKN